MRAPVAVHCAGAACLAAWSSLAWIARRPVHVDLRLFFVVIALCWAATLLATRAARDDALIDWRVVLAWAVAFRLAGLLGAPMLEDDWYRYLWDGRMLVETGTPYGTAPLSFFGDASVPERFRALLDGVNNPDLPTVYGPITQLVFALAYLLSPGDLFALKLLLLAVDLGVVLSLRRVLPPDRWLFYAWCPLLVFETAFNAHPEILGVALAIAALSARDRPLTSGALMGLAVGARMLALPLVPLVLRFDPRRWIAFAAATALAYAPFALRPGSDLSSFALMATDWQFNTLGLAILEQAAGGTGARIIAAVFLLGLALWLLRPPAGSPWPRGDLIYAASLALAPAINPWYLLWLLPFVALRPSRWGTAALAVVTLSYAHGLFLDGWGLPPYAHPWWVRPIEMSVVVGALALDLRRRQ